MRTFLVGQSRFFRAGLALILRDSAFEVESEALTLAGVTPGAHQHELILIQKPESLGEILHAIKALKATGDPPWIVLMTTSVAADELRLSFASGVDGYLLEDISPDALLDSLHLVTLGEKVFPSQLAALICAEDWGVGRQEPVPMDDALLTRRELHIVRWLTSGASNKTIAARLGISEATIKVHVKTILRKLGARNRTQAAMWAVQKGLSPSPNLLPHLVTHETTDKPWVLEKKSPNTV